MSGEMRVLSLYEGFFTGGARTLHSGVVAELHRSRRQVHSVLSIHREVRRETLRQTMAQDSNYQLLRAAGVEVASLGRGSSGSGAFTPRELAAAAEHLAGADIVLSLKEQPLRLVNQPGLPHRPVVVCLHRSDPENQGAALDDLRTAVDAGRIAAVLCCAEATRTAYRAAGIPAGLLHVVPNGANLRRFRPARAWTRARLRHALGISASAPVIAFAARYDAMKNVPLLLRSARAYLRQEPHGVVVMCGPGMSGANPLLRADIEEAFAADPDLRERLRLLGVRRDVEAIYRAADVVTLTSSVGEAAPLCLIEGLLCGAVPVATDVGDCAVIVDGHGLIVPPDPAAISAAWAEAVGRRAEFGAALDQSRARFSHRRMIASYATVIDRVRRGARLRRRALTA